MEVASGPLVAISPHLDDVVLGCGALLASHPGSKVVTVLAGRPATYGELTPWDAVCGFSQGDDVVAVRRAEDRAALSRLRATPVHLDFLDAQYGPPACIEDLANAIDAAIDADAHTVLIPMGLVHSDHALVHAAALLVMRRRPDVTWLAYEEPGYRDAPCAVDNRLAQLQRQGIETQPARIECVNEIDAKTRAVTCYASQVGAITAANDGVRGALCEPEGFWRLSVKGPDVRLTAVILTYNRRDEVLRTLRKMDALPARPALVVVDNASIDGTREAVRFAFPAARYIYNPKNSGAAARNLGIAAADTPYVALCDDDTWWPAGSLGAAADLLDAHSRLALINARVLVGEDGRPDPTSLEMARSPVSRAPCAPGPALVGFMAGAVVARRDALLKVGGFERRFFIGGEEELLALDLLSKGWELAYVPSLAVHHHPSPRREPSGRRSVAILRNRLWVAWLRRPLRHALASTYRLAARALREPEARAALGEALMGLPWAISKRRTISPALEDQLRLIE